MTDPRLRDPAQNFAYYAMETAGRYERNEARFKEERVGWAASRLRRCARVLDLGCGDGFIAELLPLSTNYVGIELNREAIRNAYPRALGAITCGNIVGFDYEKLGRFDGATCMEVLEHLPDPESLLREVKKCLKPGALLVTTSAMGRDEKHEPGNLEHLREFSSPQFAALHERAGYYVVETVALEVYRTENGARLTTGIVAVPKEK